MGVTGFVNRRVGPYLLQETLGQGGMGVVYRAVDEADGREVAVKTLLPGPSRDAVERFHGEALRHAHCVDPHVAAVYRTGRSNGVDFIAMELMATTLQARVERGPAGSREVVTIGAEILMALAAVHRAGIIHRDLKPSNIGVARTGMLKLLDFGVSAILPGSPLAEDTTPAGLPSAVVGSLPYMPPEQLRGGLVDARADIYGTGAVLYALATGRAPFPQQTGAAMIDAVLNRRPPVPSHLNPEIGGGLDRVILRAMAKHPASRYCSAAAMMDALLRQLVRSRPGCVALPSLHESPVP